jgi:hypothetical protein
MKSLDASKVVADTVIYLTENDNTTHVIVSNNIDNINMIRNSTEINSYTCTDQNSMQSQAVLCLKM